ncbi:dihydrodipicolinate synthase family protein [Arthrobacter silvisoli]|uniref:dihydrodipicolinate synthase family protein n=1 Tax=Arthrobacter silvisoli TaxID=2291022 RepID=UPI00319DE149
MTETRKPWRGVHVATALPFNEDFSVDFDAYAEHVRFLANAGCDGVAPNGSLGEYQTLSEEERGRVISTAVEAAPEGFTVMAGVGAYSALQSVKWAEQAAEAGASSLMLLPPNAYRANEDEVVEHYRRVAAVGLPIVAYNNPIDTKVDLTPQLIARLHGEGLIVGVKEFTGDVRRAYEIKELAPEVDLLIGTDDTVVEMGLAGAVGWVAGYPNAIPESTLELYRLSTSGDVADLARARTSAAPTRSRNLPRRWTCSSVPTTPSSKWAWPVPWAGWPATRTPSRSPHLSCTASPPRATFLLALPAPLGQQDRIRPGHQAVHGHRGPAGRSVPPPARPPERSSPGRSYQGHRSSPRQGLQISKTKGLGPSSTAVTCLRDLVAAVNGDNRTRRIPVLRKGAHRERSHRVGRPATEAVHIVRV